MRVGVNHQQKSSRRAVLRPCLYNTGERSASTCQVAQCQCPQRRLVSGQRSGSAHKGNEHRTTTSASANLRSEHRTKGNEQTRGNGRDVDGLCLATIIPMCYTSPGCRRVMARHHHFDGLHLAGSSTGSASPPPFRWATPHRDVDGDMPRRLHFVGLHNTRNRAVDRI